MSELKKKIEILEIKVAILENQLIRAHDLIANDPEDPESTIVKSRVILEKIIKDLYAKFGIDLPKKDKDNVIGGLMVHGQFYKNLPPRIVLRINSVREYGNLGSHDKGPVSISDGIDCLKCLIEILEWYCQKFIEEKNDYSKEIKNRSNVSKREQNVGDYQKKYNYQNKKMLSISILFILVIVPIVLMIFHQSNETVSLKSELENLNSIGINPDVKETLRVAYSSNIEGSTPSSAIAVLTNQGAENKFMWRQLQDGESLSSKDSYKIMFSPEKQAYFYVIQIDSKGKLDWLFPANSVTNFSVGNNPVNPNLWTTVPGETEGFYLDENIGIEHLYVIVTTVRWIKLEETLKKAVNSRLVSQTIKTPLKLKTRGAGGTRIVSEPSSEMKVEVSNEVQKLFTGTDGILIYEKWFQHVK